MRAGGIGIDRWRGVVREGDAAAIGDSNLWYAENARLVGGKILSRGGQAAVNTVPTSGCIDGFFDAGDMGAQDPADLPPSEGLWGVGYTALDWDDLGKVGFHYNSSMAPDLQDFEATAESGGDGESIAYVEAHAAVYIGVEGLSALVAGDNIASAIARIGIPSHAGASFATLPIINSGTSGVHQPDLISYGSQLFVANSRSNTANAALSAVYKVTSDGTVTLEDSPAQSVKGAVMGKLGTDLYVAYNDNQSDSGNALIKKRTDLGVWSSLGSPGVAGIAIYDLVEFDSKLYMVGIQGTSVYLISWDGASFTTERTIAPAGGVSGAFAALATFNSHLYFTYRATTGTTGILGKFDGAVWTDIEFSAAGITYVNIASFDGDLYLRGTGALYVSNGNDTTAFSTAFTPLFGAGTGRSHLMTVVA